MRCAILLLLLPFVACNNNEQVKVTTKVDTVTNPATLQEKKGLKPAAFTPKTYANKRFKNVVVERVGKDSFLVRGQGQIFEANLSWIVEDGHNELKKGFQTTDAGAPEWGNFGFVINVQKERPNSSLTLVLFESSAKDGSRQHQLPIPLD